MTLWFSEFLGSVKATLKLWKQLSAESGAAENQRETESASVCSGELWGEFVETVNGGAVFMKIVSFCQLTNQLTFRLAQKQEGCS